MHFFSDGYHGSLKAKRARAGSVKHKSTITLYNKMCELVNSLATLLEIQEMTDTVILQVNNFDSIHILPCRRNIEFSLFFVLWTDSFIELSIQYIIDDQGIEVKIFTTLIAYVTLVSQWILFYHLEEKSRRYYIQIKLMHNFSSFRCLPLVCQLSLLKISVNYNWMPWNSSQQ